MNLNIVIQNENNKCIINYYMFFKVCQISIIFMNMSYDTK